MTKRSNLVLTIASSSFVACACCPGPGLRIEAQAVNGGSPMALTLPMAVDMALAHNRKLQLAQLSVLDSKAQKQIAQSLYYPSLTNESRVLHITQLQGIVIPAGEFGSGTSAGTIPAQTIRIDQGASTSYTSGTGVTQPLTQLLQVHAGVRAANADLKVAKIQAQDAQDTVALQVHELYFNYVMQRSNRLAAADALRSAVLLEEENQKGVAEGHLLLNAELSSRADELEKRRSVLLSNLTLDDLTLQLDDLLGLPIGTKLDLDPEALGDLQDLPSREAAMQSVLEVSPVILAARQIVEKARASISVARDAYIPDITATARYNYQSGLPFLVHNFGSFGGAFTYVLFDGGAREAKLREAKTKLKIAETQQAQAESDAQVEIAAAYDKTEQLEELVKVCELTLQARDEGYRIQLQRAQVDAALGSTVAAAQAATTSARSQLLNAKLSLSLAKDNIVKLLGQTSR